MYLCKSLTHASLPEIGRSFGGKHHSTVIHSIKKVEELRKKDPNFNSLIDEFSAVIPVVRLAFHSLNIRCLWTLLGSGAMHSASHRSPRLNREIYPHRKLLKVKP